MTCRGICPRYKVKKRMAGGYYATGGKRCQVCDIFVDWVGYSCPCCHFKLRGKPRSGMYKNKLKQRQLSMIPMPVPGFVRIPIFRGNLPVSIE